MGRNGIDPPGSVESFVDHLTARDFDGLEGDLHPEAHLRALVPSGPLESLGADEVADRFRGWFGDTSTFEVLTSTAESLADRWHLSYRLRVDKGAGSRLCEQHAFCQVGPKGIESIDLVCSGFRVEPAHRVGEFDSGDMGWPTGSPRSSAVASRRPRRGRAWLSSREILRRKKTCHPLPA